MKIAMESFPKFHEGLKFENFEFDTNICKKTLNSKNQFRTIRQ